MKKLICAIFGHKPINERLAFKSENDNPKKVWSTHNADCSRCNSKLIAYKCFGEYSQQEIMTKYREQ